MGRKRTTNHNLPPRMHLKGKMYYHVSTDSPRKWTKLADDLGLAKRLWAEIESEQPDPNDCTFSGIVARYKKQVLPSKAPRTQLDNEKELERLVAVFGGMPIETIKPHHIKRYLEERGKTAKVRANRERALFSHVFNFARECGYTDATNPCMGVKGHREAGRDRYIEDAEFLAVWNKADAAVQDAMDLAHLTGQRPADLLKMNRSDIREGTLCLAQNKTGKKLRIEVEGELLALLERIQSREGYGLAVDALLQDGNGQRLSYGALRSRFDKARIAAKVSFQFRDIRAKTATDTEDLAHAQRLLGHRNRAMTEHYTRNRKGDKVRPLAGRIVETEKEL
ncbi:tyrosine-type recombinase/integrase [Ferriphaselus sp. R-1]|uniref:tyrosine-type recombinase/integrase n=1 Tax=Ferriphaselus sp. R-1 TaxID=1485544 RepID=UPI00068B51EB|nr:tyrosine-type recombinase/integrase [Ferriphaselus sp. R-1]